MPAAVEKLGVRCFDRLEPALEGADVVMLLRIQRERLEGSLLPSLREYSRIYGVSERQMAHASEHAIVMHPGPMNRGVEINAALADGARSVVLDQVEAGVAVRMAVLYLLSKELKGVSLREATGSEA
jgi:aspartate carbamoyltransferase catalytic subunit